MKNPGCKADSICWTASSACSSTSSISNLAWGHSVPPIFLRTIVIPKNCTKELHRWSATRRLLTHFAGTRYKKFIFWFYISWNLWKDNIIWNSIRITVWINVGIITENVGNFSQWWLFTCIWRNKQCSLHEVKNVSTEGNRISEWYWKVGPLLFLKVFLFFAEPELNVSDSATSSTRGR